MTILKIIFIALLVSSVFGVIAVKYALNKGMYVPTNQELINGTKAAIEAKKQQSQETKTGPVKAKDIKKLKK